MRREHRLHPYPAGRRDCRVSRRQVSPHWSLGPRSLQLEIFGYKTVRLVGSCCNENENAREAICFPFIGIAEQLDLDGFFPHSVFSQESHDSVETFSWGFVFVEKVACQEDKVNLWMFRADVEAWGASTQVWRTSFFTANWRISSKVMIESWPRIGSRSL